MYQKTEGIVLNSLNYNDKYMLVQIFTEGFGRATYMVARNTGKSSKVSRSLFMPLAILDMEVEHKATREIHRIREAHSAFPLYSIPSNMVKSSIVFFLSEFLSKTLKNITDKNLYNFLCQSIQILEMSDRNVANFHLVFLVKMTHFLGFYPNLEEYKDGHVFDMINGEFVKEQPLHKHVVTFPESKGLSRLGKITYENMHKFEFSRQDRINVINRIIEYYHIHLHDFSSLKTLDVLHELF